MNISFLKKIKLSHTEKIISIPHKPFFQLTKYVWYTILFGVFIVGIGVLILDGIIFYKINNDTFFDIVPTRSFEQIVDQNKLDNILKEFKARSDRFNAISAKIPIVIDPSR